MTDIPQPSKGVRRIAVTEESLWAWGFDPLPIRVTPKDAMFFGLSMGLGANPTDPMQLRHVYENGLLPYPMMPVVLGSPGMWFGLAGLDAPKVLHGAVELEVLSPLPLDTDLVAHNAISDVIDRGAGRGAVVEVTRRIKTLSGSPVARVVSTYMAMGDGGFIGEFDPEQTRHSKSRSKPRRVSPERVPDVRSSITTLPQAALIYRLNGDTNPLHVDPAVAVQLGFDRPILHGLCTLGHCLRPVLDAVAAGDAMRLSSVSVRMSQPVFPGEPLAVSVWQSPEGAQFEARASERNVTVLSGGAVTVLAPH